MDNFRNDSHSTCKLHGLPVYSKSIHFLKWHVIVRLDIPLPAMTILTFILMDLSLWGNHFFRYRTILQHILKYQLISKFIFMLFALSLLFCEASYSQHHKNKKAKNTTVPKNTQSAKAAQSNTVNGVAPFESSDSTELPCTLVAYAKTLIGTPYLYASVDPKKGFDCSGFITHVFSHFNLSVPRSSVDFTNYGREILKQESKPGDLILFTGTDSTNRVVGHMGIVVENINGEIQFIHSSSGTANGVVITRLTQYYLGRFVKITRVFKALE